MDNLPKLAKKERLMSSFVEYENLNKEILHLNKDDIENVDVLEERYFFCLSRLNDLIVTLQLDDEKEMPPVPLAQTKLPNIEISNFDGRYSEYPQFMNIFTSVIHNNPSLDNVQRLYYLRSFLRGEPLDLIKNLPICRESYPEAQKILQERYDNKFLTMNDHITQLLDLEPVQSSAASLRNFVSMIKQQLAALRNLDASVNSWDSLLICIFSRKLDNDTVKTFLERDIKTEPSLKKFLEFLEKRALAMESIEQRSGLLTAKNELAVNVSSESGNLNMMNCAFCNSSPHRLYYCPKFKLTPITDRVKYITENSICKTCLNQHSGRCRYLRRCNKCKKSHNTLLHVADPDPQVALLSNNNGTVPVLLPTVSVKVLSSSGLEVHLRALLDSGSQVSFITHKALKGLGMTPYQSDVNIVGIANVSNKIKYSIPIMVHSLAMPYKLIINCNVVDKITCQLPQNKFESFKLPSGIKLADKDYNVPSDIDMLMGCDVFFQVLLQCDQQVLHHNADAAFPCFINTRFGYVIAGALPSKEHHHVANNKVSLLCTTCNSSINNSLKGFWKTEEVPQIFNEKSAETDLCQEIFKNTYRLNNDQFEVDLPLKVPIEQVKDQLGDSFNLALNRFFNLEKRLLKNVSLYEQYKCFINQIVELGHGHYVDITEYDFKNDPIYFLPHHAVIREESISTKLRVVFDGSMKTNKKISLNDILLSGPVVQADLFDIILRFRLGSYLFLTDIRKMFRCIKLNPSHSVLQNILWRENPNQEIKCIRLDTVTYGLKSSSFLATQCLNELAAKYKNELPLAAFIIENCSYVDDVIYSESDMETIIQAKTQLIKLLSKGNFQTHKWASNVPKILQDMPTGERNVESIDFEKQTGNIKTLGLKFNIKNDCFVLDCPSKFENRMVTKRSVLSYISSFFDPLGFISPIVVLAKCFIQKLWTADLEWDSVLPECLMREWSLFTDNLNDMQPISLPRNICTQHAFSIQLIGFSDASNMAYGCCIYMRVLYCEIAKLHLLCSKSRINPLDKQLTIPRLELNAALLLSKLMARVNNALNKKVSINNIYLFTDSKIVLAWINTQTVQLNAYVANRVTVILQLTDNWSWDYVSTNNNPADLISRGVQPSELQNSCIWWQGPAFLQDSRYSFSSNVKLPTMLPETKPKPANPGDVTLSATKEDLSLFIKYSDINVMVRVVAYILRFINNSKIKIQENRVKNKFLTSSELINALLIIVKHEQYSHFYEYIQTLEAGKSLSGPLASLYPFIDREGVMRVGGRLQNSDLSYSQKHPVILPKESRVTEMIIHSEHLRLLHAGAKLLLSNLNQRFWLLNGLREVKKIIHRCVTCFKLKAVAARQLMGSLPAQRVVQSRPFQKVGVDYAGPFNVKQSRIRRSVVSKGYICLFVCFATKAIHLELASDLTTATFLACFKRFIARRGLPSDVFSDNASTFKGARNQLATLYKLNASKDHQSQVIKYATCFNINFHFIPSYSPVFGGLWEAAVKSTKFHLKRTVEKAVLTYEELYTVLVQIEAVLNSRPLIPLSTNPNEFAYLTPGHFLTGSALVSYPEQDVSNSPVSKLRLWNITNKMVQSFWRIWHKHYLNMLQCRPKWKDVTVNVKVGDLVLLKDDNTEPLTWPMARVTKVFPGSDSHVRAFEVMTPNRKTHIRSITKVCLFPINVS